MATVFSSVPQANTLPGGPQPAFAARTVIDRGALVVHIAGELGLAGRHLVTHSCLQDGHLIVRVDMTELTFIDGDGFGGLIAAKKILERCGGSLTFLHACGQPHQFLTNNQASR